MVNFGKTFDKNWPILVKKFDKKMVNFSRNLNKN